MIIGRGDIGANAREMRRLCDGRKILRCSNVRAAVHSNLSIRVGKRGGPLHGVVTVLRFVFERIPVACGLKPAADILGHYDIAARRGLGSELHLMSLVVGRAHQQDRKFSGDVGPVNIRTQLDPVAHCRHDAMFDRDSVGF